MNGTTMGCEGRRNMLVLCQVYPPGLAVCTVESPGSVYADATGGNDTGTMEAAGRVGTCSATAVPVGPCCGGAVTEVSVCGFYGNAECVDAPCPGT